MCCERLICAACAGPVVDAACPTCRVSRASVHQAALHLPEWLVATAVLLVTLTVLLVTYA